MSRRYTIKERLGYFGSKTSIQFATGYFELDAIIYLSVCQSLVKVYNTIKKIKNYDLMHIAICGY